MKNTSLEFQLKPDIIVSRIFWGFLGFELFIVFLDVFVNHYKWSSIGAIRRMVNITREDSISNWFSSIQLIIVGLVLWTIALAVKNNAKDSKEKKKYYCWAGIACFFIYMGVDDAIKFHERVGAAFKTIISRLEASSDPGFLGYVHNIFPSYAWQIVFGPIFIAIAAFMLWFLLKELSPRNLKNSFIAALGLYAVATGLDFVEGLDTDPYNAIANFFSTSTERIRHMSKAIEEFYEMFGTTIFLTVFLRKLFSLCQRVEISFKKPKA